MDPNEIIKAAPEIAKGAGPLAAAIPFTGIVKRMLGHAEYRKGPTNQPVQSLEALAHTASTAT
jgi:hypothetical protein